MKSDRTATRVTNYEPTYESTYENTYEPLIKQTYKKRKTIGEVFSDAWAKTFTTDMDHVKNEEFDTLTVEALADKYGIKPAQIAQIERDIKQYRANPWIRFLAFIGAPNRFDLYEQPSLIGVLQQFIGFQPKRRKISLGSLVNFLLAITLIKPAFRLLHMALTTARSIIKLPTQFLATFFADWMEKSSSRSNFWHAMSFIPWLFELIYTAALSPADSAQRGYVAGQEYAERLFGENSKVTGFIFGVALSLLSIGTTVAIWAGSFGLLAQYGPIDIAAKLGDAMTTTQGVSWITAKLGWVSTNIVTPILNGVGLGGLTAAPALLAIETWIMSSTLVVALSPAASWLAEKAEHFWNTFDDKYNEGYALINEDEFKSNLPYEYEDKRTPVINDLSSRPSDFASRGNNYKPGMYQAPLNTSTTTTSENLGYNNNSTPKFGDL